MLLTLCVVYAFTHMIQQCPVLVSVQAWGGCSHSCPKHSTKTYQKITIVFQGLESRYGERHKGKSNDLEKKKMDFKKMHKN